jgi:hypothetical protein
MRITRLRFTIKRMMLAVAVVAVIMGGYRVARLSGRYLTAAKYFADWERWGRQGQGLVQNNFAGGDGLVLLLGPNPLFEDKAAQAAAARTLQEAIDYCAAARRRYERAAARPWLSIDAVR